MKPGWEEQRGFAEEAGSFGMLVVEHCMELLARCPWGEAFRGLLENRRSWRT